MNLNVYIYLSICNSVRLKSIIDAKHNVLQIKL